MAIDKSNMYDVLKNFPEQVKHAVEIGQKFDGFPNKPKSSKFVILGMGGSAIGGDLLASYLCNLKSVPGLDISTSRNYTLPKFVDEKTNIIVSSYSGDTEETVSAFNQAIWLSKNIIGITTGGKIRQISSENNVSIVSIPAGYQPRCAVGYSFFPMLIALLKTGLIGQEKMNDISYEIEMTQNTIDVKAKQYSELKDTNLAIQIAKKIQGSIPVIYSASDGFESVNTRWVRQIQENAKQLVFNGLLPEMNHNEINSFSNPDILPKKISLIYIKDEADNPRTKIRFNALKEIIGKQVKQIIEIQSTEQNALSRMFDLLYLGDWVSYYLAILNEIDPTPIPLITKLKDYLSQF